MLCCAGVIDRNESSRRKQEEDRDSGEWRRRNKIIWRRAPGNSLRRRASLAAAAACCRRDHGPWPRPPPRLGRMMAKARGRSSFCPPVKDSHNRNGHRQQRIAAVAASFRETFRGTMCDGRNIHVLNFPVFTTVTTELLLLLPEQSTYLLPATVPVWPHPKPENEDKKERQSKREEHRQSGRDICKRCCP